MFGKEKGIQMPTPGHHSPDNSSNFPRLFVSLAVKAPNIQPNVGRHGDTTPGSVVCRQLFFCFDSWSKETSYL